MSLARKLGALFGAAGTGVDATYLPSMAAAPTGTMVPFAGSAAPTGWLFCYGQAVSRITEAALFAVIGTAHGAGDGSTTFNLPDMRGRVPAGKDNMGGSAASRLTTAGAGVDGTTLGAVGGTQTHTLSEAQLPAHTHTGSTASAGSHSHSYTAPSGAFNVGVGDTSYNVMPGGSTTDTVAAHTHAVTIANTGSGTAHNNTQPTLVSNYIIKT